MKKILVSLIGILILANSVFAVYVTSNTASTAWNSTAVAASTESSSDFVITSGCSTGLLTMGNSTTSTDTTAEAHWYLVTEELLTSEAITSGTTFQVRTPKAKFGIHNNNAVARTLEAIVYCY